MMGAMSTTWPAPSEPGAAAATGLSDARRRAHHMWAVLLVHTVTAWIVLPRVLQSITAPKYRVSVGMPSPPYSTVAALSLTLLTLATLGLCCLILLDTVRDPHESRLLPLLVLLAPWLLLAMRDLFAGSSPRTEALLYPLVVAALWRLRTDLRVVAHLGYAVGVAALLSLLLAATLPSKGIFSTETGALVTDDKTVLPWGILVGFLTHGNSMGLFMVLGLPAVMLVPRRWLRWALAGLVLFAILWSASRSAFIALLCALLAAAATLAVPRAARVWVGALVPLVPFAVMAVLPFVVTEPAALRFRGLIWTVSREAWASSWLVGLGSGWFSDVGSSSQRLAGTVFHAHNQFLQLLVTGGLLLAVAGIALVGTACVRAGQMARAGSAFGAAYLAALAGTGTLDVTFMFVDNLSMFPVVVLPLALILLADLPDPVWETEEEVPRGGAWVESREIRHVPPGRGMSEPT
jgi:hypothetical protein